MALAFAPFTVSATSQLFLLCMAVHKRSNWLFAGSLRAGQRAAAVMSLAQSAKLHGHDPYRYLKDILERLPMQPASRLEELLPRRWQGDVAHRSQ